MGSTGEVKTGAEHRALRHGRRAGCRRHDADGLPQRGATQVAALCDHQARPENLERKTFASPIAGGYTRIDRCGGCRGVMPSLSPGDSR